jgi:hypothetical protein
MSVFMEPVIDELVRAWEEGVWTYDRDTKTKFKMHVWYHYSLHDFLTYGIFCTWCVHGKFSCPICKEGLRFIWLQKGGKYSSFENIDNSSLLTIHSDKHQELYERCRSDRPCTLDDHCCHGS